MFDKAKRYLRFYWRLYKWEMWARYAWLEWVLPFEVIDLLFGLATWVYFGKALGSESPFLRPYGGDFLAYLILGMSFNAFLSYSLGGIYDIVSVLYTGSWSAFGVRMSMAEYISIARIPLSIWIVSRMSWGYFVSFLRLIVYVGAGVLLFGMRLNPSANYGLGVLALLLGICSAIGLGMISASMIWLVGAWHGNEPIRWFVRLLVNLASGVYFPPEVLPGWIRGVAELLPQTHSLRAARLAILRGASFGELGWEFLVLSLMALLLLCGGGFLFRYSQELARRRGALSA